MGQRHQIFVKILNPLNELSFNTDEEKKKATKELGTGKYCILAYHNQWLFGRSALQQALSLLMFGKQFSHKSKTGERDDYGSYNCPFSKSGFNEFNSIQKIADGIAMVLNLRLRTTAWLSAGIGSTWYLGSEEGMNQDFTRGDNNDGITIIDVVENKYCFMNIDKQRDDDYSASALPSMVPVDAKAYVQAYYGETLETLNPYYKENKTEAQTSKLLQSNIKVNAQAYRGFKNFGVLTLAEIQAMFPKMDLTNKSLVVSN